MIAVAEQFGPALHHVERGPALGVNDVGAGKSLFHGVDHPETAPGFLRLFPGQLYHVGNQPVAFGIREIHLHAETGHQSDDPLGNGEGFAVTGRIGPGHGDLFSFQVFERSENTLQVQQVGHRLGRVVDVALQVDDPRALRKHAVGKGLVQRGSHLSHVGVAGTEEHVVADADDVAQEGDHGRGLANGLPVGDLRFALVEVLHGKSKQVGG